MPAVQHSLSHMQGRTRSNVQGLASPRWLGIDICFEMAARCGRGEQLLPKGRRLLPRSIVRNDRGLSALANPRHRGEGVLGTGCPWAKLDPDFAWLADLLPRVCCRSVRPAHGHFAHLTGDARHWLALLHHLSRTRLACRVSHLMLGRPHPVTERFVRAPDQMPCQISWLRSWLEERMRWPDLPLPWAFAWKVRPPFSWAPTSPAPHRITEYSAPPIQDACVWCHWTLAE